MRTLFTPFHRNLLGFCLLVLLSWAATPSQATAQCQAAAHSCSASMTPYNSDGAYYRAELFDGESAKLKTTFYSGMTYRLIPCGKSNTGKPLILEVYDRRGVGIFNSRSVPGQNFFDINFGATGEYTLVVRFDDGDGCAAVLIGYKQS